MHNKVRQRPTSQQPCFFFQSPFKGKNSNDLLGSPVPDTPMAHRKQREKALRSELSQNRNSNNPIFSSRYNGLEKEDTTNNNNNNNGLLGKKQSSSSSQKQQKKKHGKNNNNNNNNNGFVAKDTLDMAESQFYAEIHEGPVRTLFCCCVSS